jgi:cold shock CspA family protein
VQGTIKDYDGATGRGTILTDDRAEIAIDERSAAAEDSYRMLRFGQRVRFEVIDEEGRQTARDLRLVTFEGG